MEGSSQQYLVGFESWGDYESSGQFLVDLCVSAGLRGVIWYLDGVAAGLPEP